MAYNKDRPCKEQVFSFKELNDAFDYNPSTGIFKHRVKPRKWGIQAGDTAGSMSNGYLSLHYKGVNLMAHRVAWYLFYGKPALKIIDHINRDKSDNRITNLRESTHRDNIRNSTSASSTPGIKCVKGRWCAIFFIGSFESFEKAQYMYQKIYDYSESLKDKFNHQSS